VAGTLGYCGLDRTRQPLAGDEIRPCWEAGPVGANTTPIPLTALPADGADRPRPIEFVEVGSGSIPTAVTGGATSAASAPAEPAGPGSRATLPPSPILPASEPGWSLWGDTER
jgi:hypothetical protein